MKAGIEVHQRLDTEKLFCACSSRVDESEAPCMKVVRRLHPVFSELGEVDAASQAEFAKGRAFEYHVFRSNNCLVELDEEPPGTMNSDALGIGLQIALALNAKPVGEVQVMRKMVIDGSNTSGFQRTAVIAMGGHLDTSRGTVGIPLIAIEEESAGIVQDGGKSSFRLDRLGIPLIEISTSPDIKDGAHLAEVAEKIGMLLRSTGKVARGLGTIRQDVNVSTEGGARVEIKGAQDLKMLAEIVANEEKRQTALVGILAELRSRKALPAKKHMADVSGVFSPVTGSKLIDAGLKAGSAVMGLRLAGHKDILGREIQPGRRYGTELSDYAKRAGVKGIIHSDESMEKYSISPQEEGKVRELLSLGPDDAFVLVVAPKEQAEKALGFVLERANMDFVPAETRRANPDGTSTYMRPLPGRARLYPETDVPPILITQEMLERVERTESLEDRKARLEKLLNKEMAGRMLKSRHLHLFERLVEKGTEPMLAAATIEDTVVALRREGVQFSDLDKALTELFDEYKRGSFVKAAIPEVLKGMAKGARADAVLKVFRLQKITGPALGKLVAESGYDMKAVMQKYRLQVDAAEVAALLKGRKK
ncbi:MAG: Glu-tRNA(Gln) amidotransferase subunit GatE [Candidatus Micrarchaeota archaeon]